MKIKSIRFAHEIENLDIDNVGVLVESKSGYTYVIVVTTTKDLDDEIIVENEAYWLKLCQFGDEINLSVLNRLENRHREKWELFELEGLDKVFYYIQKFLNIPSENRVLIKPMLFFLMSIYMEQFYYISVILPNYYYDINIS